MLHVVCACVCVCVSVSARVALPLFATPGVLCITPAKKVLFAWAIEPSTVSIFSNNNTRLGCEQYPNNTLLFVVLDKLYCNLYVPHES